ncbi:MAG: helix-turn-helix domain-containing protein [Pseudomonadota bacterium]
MDKSDELREIVRVFAQYGFRKTSMRDLAESLGISRQAFYNRFPSKEAAFEWAALSLIQQSRDACLSALNGEGPVRVRIAEAFYAWIGQYVDLFKAAPHSAEIVTMVSDVSSEKVDKAAADIRKAIVKLLKNSSPGRTRGDAEALALTIHMAAKGLLSVVDNSRAYRRELERIINILPLD